MAQLALYWSLYLSSMWCEFEGLWESVSCVASRPHWITGSAELAIAASGWMSAACVCMLRCCRRNPETSRATDNNIEDQINMWLKFVKDRDGARHVCYEKAMQNTWKLGVWTYILPPTKDIMPMFVYFIVMVYCVAFSCNSNSCSSKNISFFHFSGQCCSTPWVDTANSQCWLATVDIQPPVLIALFRKLCLSVCCQDYSKTSAWSWIKCCVSTVWNIASSVCKTRSTTANWLWCAELKSSCTRPTYSFCSQLLRILAQIFIQHFFHVFYMTAANEDLLWQLVMLTL